jgi:hypothetical protein
MDNKMKPRKNQIEVMQFCKSIIDTWINTNDINSPTHETDLHDFINADLYWLFDEDKEDIENFMLNLHKFIKSI